MKYTYQELAQMIDHALLHPTLTDRHFHEGFEVAKRFEVASVCVAPYAVPAAVEALRGSPVQVGTVVGFPHGTQATEVKCYEAEAACLQGALEIDLVINIGKALSHDWAFVQTDIGAVVELAHRHGALAKVIFENGLLPDDAAKIRLCRICDEVGADFIKTSTGFGFIKDADGRFSCPGAQLEDVRLMRRHTSSKVRIKAAGGVRSLRQLIDLREAGCSRCGTSATAAILEEYRRHVAC